MFWLHKGLSYAVDLRVQNPVSCTDCQPSWKVFLAQGETLWSVESPGFALVGSVAAYTIIPSHRLGDSTVLLTFQVSFGGRLLLYDEIHLTVPSGWKLDPDFCASPVVQAGISGLKAPPRCMERQAILTVFEMDSPPLSSPSIQLRLEGLAPNFAQWKELRTQWLSIVGQAGSLPLEFAVEVQRGLDIVAAGKTQAYELLPNMAPQCQLAISSASLSSLAAMRLSFRPSESIDALVNSVSMRSSLPYNFQGCSLLWEEPAARRAARPQDPTFAFAGEPRCIGQLNQLTLLAVLLDTSIKDQVTLYVANFTVPEPPYAAQESRWEVVLQRVRTGLLPEIVDQAIGLPGPGAFGRLYIADDAFAGNLQAGQLNMLFFSMQVTVPLLAGSIVRVVAPPKFQLDANPGSFEGVSKHFPQTAAASAVLRTRMNMSQVYGTDAADGMVEVLMLRVLIDALPEERLEFKMVVRNPEGLDEGDKDLNRWIVETMATSGLVVNSNRLSWLSFEPLPMFVASAPPYPEDVAVNASTSVTLSLGVSSRVAIAPSVSLLLEILAPQSYRFEDECFDNSTVTENWLPFADSCSGIGRLAQVRGLATSDWEPGNFFNIKLRLARNGDIDSNRDERWFAELWMSATPANSSETSQPSSTVVVGPAIVARDAAAALWDPLAMGRSKILRMEDRLLVIDTSWLVTKGMNVTSWEVAVLLADGSFGTTTAAALRNAPADDVPRPLGRNNLEELVLQTSIGGYLVEGASAAIGVGTVYGQADPTAFVIGIQLATASALRLGAIRVAAPPHYTFSCDEISAGNTRLLSTAAASSCRAIVSPFESVVQLEDAAAEGPEHGYNRGMHWWLGGRLQVTPASGWDEERRSWEVELADQSSDLRIRVRRPSPSPQPSDTAWLLSFEVLPTMTGRDQTTFIDLHFSIRFFNLESPPEEIYDPNAAAVLLLLKAPRSVPFDRGVFRQGTCVETLSNNLLFPDDTYLGRPPSECTTVQLTIPYQDLQERSKAGAAPHLLRGGLRVAVVLPQLCRPPMPPCADFFSLSLGEEPLTLFGRSNLLEEQLKIGSVGVDQGCASSLTTQALLLTVLLLLAG